MCLRDIKGIARIHLKGYEHLLPRIDWEGELQASEPLGHTVAPDGLIGAYLRCQLLALADVQPHGQSAEVEGIHGAALVVVVYLRDAVILDGRQGKRLHLVDVILLLFLLWVVHVNGYGHVLRALTIGAL